MLHGGSSTTEPSTRTFDDGLLAFLGVGFERSSMAMLLIDGNQRIRCANAAAAVMFTSNDVAGRSTAEFRAPEFDADSTLEVTRLLAGEVHNLDRVAVVLADSGPVQVTMRVDAVTPPSGVRLFLMQLRDVTSTVAQETAREQSEMQYRQLVDNLPGMSVLTFDRDLRLIKAGGEALDRARDDAGALPGQLLTDVLPASALALLEGPYRGAVDGESADFDYDSPVDGRQYRIRLRPVPDQDGKTIGGLALTEDVSADRARQTLLEQMQQLSNVGTVSYNRTGGWVVDAELVTLLGMDSGEDVLEAMGSFVLPEDRESVLCEFRNVLAIGGETTQHYRLIHGKTGQLRHVVATMRAMVDTNGTLLRVIATHADVTDVVEGHDARVKSADDRTALLRSVSEALANAPGSVHDMLQSIVDVATGALGDGTVLRLFIADGSAVEVEMTCDRAKVGGDRAKACLLEATDGVGQGVLDSSGAAGELWSSIRNAQWREDFQRRMGLPVVTHIQHFISAAVRHDRVVLGYLRVYRTDRTRPYKVGDDDLIQVLADRIGSVITESRVREELARQRSEHQALADRLQELTTEQRELLEQLANVEERERTLLAEAIHDGPMQLVVAVMMSLENYSINRDGIDDDEMERLIVTLETSIQRLRTLIIALTPPDLSKGLGMALRKLAEGIFLGTPTEITVLGDAHVHLTALSKGNAHRILREAMVNARKHAHAEHVVLELSERDGTVVARLTDDGVGAAHLDAGEGHLGMATMRARADADGGRLDVISEPGKGTTILLTLPVAPAGKCEHHDAPNSVLPVSAGPADATTSSPGRQ